MKVAVTLDLSAIDRLALNARVGKRGPATRETCAATLSGLLRADLDVIVSEYRAAVREACQDPQEAL